jgi:EAL domain-containing protein (putative c-di-GMP-specific phosphodiesterase class I)
MYSVFIEKRIAGIRQGLNNSDIGVEARRHSERLIRALEEGAFCFRIEPWHDVSLRSAFDVGSIGEMLLHVFGQENTDFNIRWAIGTIYEGGYYRDFDEVIVALALQQAEAQGNFPAAINISPESACDKKFWENLAPVLGNYNPHDVVFELLEEDYNPGEQEVAVLKAARKMGYRFALDDVENNFRDEDRMKAFGECVDFIKIAGEMIEEWELGVPGLASFVEGLRARASNSQFIAEWVSSAAKARFLAEMGFNAVQGRYLPLSRVEFTRRLNRTPTVRMRMAHGGLKYSFASLGA